MLIPETSILKPSWVEADKATVGHVVLFANVCVSILAHWLDPSVKQ